MVDKICLAITAGYLLLLTLPITCLMSANNPPLSESEQN